MPFQIIQTVRPTANTSTDDSFTAVSTRRHYTFGMRRIQKREGLRTFLREESWPAAVRREVERWTAQLARTGKPVTADDFVVLVAPTSEPIHIGQKNLVLHIHRLGPHNQLSAPRQVQLDGKIIRFESVRARYARPSR